jgi:hypothetical protein
MRSSPPTPTKGVLWTRFGRVGHRLDETLDDLPAAHSLTR